MSGTPRGCANTPAPSFPPIGWIEAHWPTRATRGPLFTIERVPVDSSTGHRDDRMSALGERRQRPLLAETAPSRSTPAAAVGQRDVRPEGPLSGSRSNLRPGHFRSSELPENRHANDRLQSTAVVGRRPFEGAHSPKQSPTIVRRWSASDAGRTSAVRAAELELRPSAPPFHGAHPKRNLPARGRAPGSSRWAARGRRRAALGSASSAMQAA
jgi:hypothetical protein